MSGTTTPVTNQRHVTNVTFQRHIHFADLSLRNRLQAHGRL